MDVTFIQYILFVSLTVSHSVQCDGSVVSIPLVLKCSECQKGTNIKTVFRIGVSLLCTVRTITALILN